jgi:gliding motility-associated-like protein
MTRYILLPLLVFLSFKAFTQTHIPTWVNTIGSNARDEAFDLTTDTLHNYYITGRFSGTADFDPSAAVYNLTSNGSTDIFVAKYSANGNFIWAFSVGGSNIDGAQAIKINHAGEVLVTGYFRGANVDFNPGAGSYLLNGQSTGGIDNGFGGDIFIAKYSGNGNFIWAFSIPNTYIQNSGYGIDVDSVDNIYVTGATNSTSSIIADFDPGPGVYNLSTATDGHAFVAKYTTLGNFVWAFSIGSWGLNSSGTRIHVNDNDTTFIVIAHVTGTNVDLDPGPGVSIINTISNDVVVAKYSLNKTFIWGFGVGGSAVDDPRGLYVHNGAIYVSGYFGSTNVDFDPSPATYLLSASIGLDVFVAKYTDNGQFMWARRFGNTGQDIGYGITGFGNTLLVTGEFGGTVDFDPSAATFNLTSSGNQDIFISKFDTLGNFICAEKIGGAQAENSYAIHNLAADSFIICGNYGTNNIDFDPSPTSLTKTNAGQADIFLGKYYTSNSTTSMNPVFIGDTICVGGNAQLTINFGAGYPGPYTIVINNGSGNQTYSGILSGVPFTPIPSPSSTTTYTLISVSSPIVNCSSISIPPGISASITINPPPAITAIATPNAVCIGGAAVLSGSGASSYTWSGGVINGISFTPSTTATYTVTGTDAFGCTNTATVSIAVNPNPAITAVASPQQVCIGSPTTLTGNGGILYSWSGGITNGVAFIPTAPLTYTVIGTDANGCTNTSSVSVSLLPLPTVSASASPSLLCPGDAVVLFGGGALSYSWSGGVSNGVAFIPSASATYTVTGTDANGCSNTASIFITVLPPPAVTAIASPASVCQNSPTTLSGAGALSYTWSGGVTNGVPFTPTSTSTYTVTGTDANGCTQTSTVTVNVVTDVLINIIPNNPILCLGDSIQLTASGAISYNWIPNSNISATTGSNPFVFPAATTTYTVTGTDATGCTGTSTVTIDIINDPKLTVTKSGDVECNTNTIQLAASGAASYSWSPASLLSAPNGAVTNATVFEPTTFVVTGVVGSCIVTDSIRVNVYNNDEAAIFIPNAFTPNGDGNNDCLRVLNKANFSKYYFTVYNRWGQRVFEADNSLDCWDGTFNGQQVQLGTYYFFLQGETRCGKVFKKGDITVIY